MTPELHYGAIDDETFIRQPQPEQQTRGQYPPFKETTLGQVAGFLKYRGQPKTLDELEQVIGREIREQW